MAMAQTNVHVVQNAYQYIFCRSLTSNLCDRSLTSGLCLSQFHCGVVDNRDLTQQDGWKTQDDRMTKKSRARLCIPGLEPVLSRLSLPAVLLRQVSVVDNTIMKLGQTQIFV